MKTPRYIRTLCMLLVLALLVQLLPARALAAGDGETLLQETSAVSGETVSQPAHIVQELPEKRTEYSKEFRLSNGLHMAAVYGESIHYAKDGQWQEIDNTLVATASGYRNTAGIWNVTFPQTFSGTNAVTIEKDGYTLSFYLSGQVRRPTLGGIGQENITVQAASESAAQVQALDRAALRENAQYPETVLEKNRSQLRYNNVFANNYVQYDLAGNQVKESIVIGAYDEALQGYRYTLNTGDLIPVLTGSNDIVLLGSDKETVVMVMPAPYLLDAAGEYSGDVAVSLTGSRGVYTLTYTLPRAWMADESRQYPVVLDPVVDGGSNRDNIEDITICQTGSLSASLLSVGWIDTRGTIRSLIKFLELPQLSEYDTVVEASFTLNLVSASSAGFPVGVHKVESAWDKATVTWTNQPGHNPIVEDFSWAEKEDVDYTWDVTEIVRDWYLTGNTGLMLRGPDYAETSGTGGHLLQFGGEGYSKYDLPTLTISYRSTIGIEPYYTYATLGAGNAGGAYLSDSTGQITAVRGLASYASTVNPFDLNMVYNSIYFRSDAASEYSPLEEMGLAMTMGNGWTLDIVQKIEPETIGETSYLKYTDGDGTVHYLRKKSSKYYDEDGLGLTVVANSNGSYTMTDEMDNQWTFTNLGLTDYPDARFLTATQDWGGNGYQINYTSGKLTSIVQQNRQQTAITVAQFEYTGDQLTAVLDATGERYILGYSSGNLTQVSRQFASGAASVWASYTYDQNRLTAMTDTEQSYSLHLTYGGLVAGKRAVSTGRVTSYYEVSNGTEGIRCDISYPSYSQTTYHSYGNDRTENTADDLYTHYLTDFAGRTVNAYTTDATGTQILGASTAVYTENDGISKKNNRTERTASIGMAAQKLLTGGDFEGSTDLWTRTNADIYESGSQNYISHTGHRALQGILSNTSTVATGCRETEVLQANTPYTLSAYIRATHLENFQTENSNLTYGPGVYIKIVTSDGIAYCTDPIDYTTDSTVDNGWVPVVMTFTPQVTGVATAYIIGEGAQGIFYVDDIQLEKGEAPSNFNLLENGDLQSDDTSAFGWTLKEDVSFCNTVGVNATGQGNHSIKIEGDCQNKYAYAIQTVYINKLGQQSYVLSGWGKADAVVDNITLRSNPAYDHTKQFGLRATVYYRGDTNGEYTEYFYVPYNPDLSTWQYASLTVTPEQTNKYVDHINISCVYECNANTAWFDNLSLVSATVQQVDYDDNGKPISSASTGLNGQSITYDDNGNVKTVTTPNPAGGKITTTYTYDSTFTHRLVSSTNGIVKQSMSHDSVGNVVSTTLQSATNSSAKVITSSAVFTGSGNLQSSVTDSAGSVTSYAYETARNIAWGAPSKVTDAKGTETAYTFDNFGRYENITVDNGAGLTYNYSNGKLSQIQRKADGQTTLAYHFVYDEFGNTEEIKVGNKLLASYDYIEPNGLLLSQSYGNGASVSFTYDNLGRAKTTTYSSGRVLSYIYTGDGQLYSVHDSATGYTYIYTYDSLGRLISSQVDSSGETLMRTKLWYNASNQITKQTWTIGDTTYQETYAYNTGDATLSSYHNPLGQTVSLSYDYLRRLSTVTAGDIYTLTYTYRDLDDTKTTAQVSSLSYSGFTDAHSFGYTYDALGNIATYTENGVTYTYTYDDLNQLVSQTGGGKAWAYTYDLGGNILTATDGTTSHTYTYGDADWADLLTAFDGEAITYDNSGNPLSYYNGNRYTFAWAEGRRLTSAAVNGKTYTYAYDSDGLRLSKTVDGVTHNYFYASDKLLRETYGNVTLDFLYDNHGYPYALIYTAGETAATYYYITNLQGDVLGLIDGSGNTVATYTYDPYGKVLTATGTMAESNPLRYRGYVYDTETGLYYLQSRYYDPTTCRFINADAYASTGQGLLGHNMFAYCGNNAVIRTDAQGYFWWEIIVAVIAFASGYAVSTVAVNENKRVCAELDAMPDPSADITESFSQVLEENAETIKRIIASEGRIDAFGFFYRSVRKGGQWDYKQYPEYSGTFLFCGDKVQGQDLGNINFGYTGTALGLPKEVLLHGAGYAQMKAGTSTFEMKIVSRGDDLRDQLFIIYGIALYKENN